MEQSSQNSSHTTTTHQKRRYAKTCTLIACFIGAIIKIYHNVNIHKDTNHRIITERSLKSSTTTDLSKEKTKSRCALLFFGLPKLFENKALPSIKKYILDVNPKCDVFVHTYDISSVSNTPRNHEKGTLNPSEVYRLTDNVLIQTMDDFDSTRDLSIYRLHHFRGWGECCHSTDNMIKQWHSIDAVWNLMEEYGLKKQKEIGIGRLSRSHHSYYDRVGLFRSDVLYLNPIDVSDGAAVIPTFASENPKAGINDRMFYGLYKYAKIWATARFDYYYHYTTHINDQVRSENYLQSLLYHYDIPIETRDVCFWRLRVNQRVYVQDCRVSGERAEEHVAFLDGLMCERKRGSQFACSIYVNHVEDLAYDESVRFTQRQQELVGRFDH